MKFYSYSFGCRVNHAEKESLDRMLLKSGWTMTENNPDYFIINSCAITQKAEKEVRDFIKKIKKTFPKVKIILTGCAATHWKNNKLNGNLPIFSIFENKKKNFIFNFLSKNLVNKKNNNPKSDRFLASNRVVIKIQDGCNRFCSYCIVPFLRTEKISKTISQIISEINSDPEYKEVILTAINSELFGEENNESLGLLIDEIIKKTQIPRISFGSINPWSIDSSFLKILKKHKSNNRLVHFFHIPIQSGSDKILKLMKRDYKVSEIKNKILAINKIFPKALIATDMIVGFPNEKPEDFQKTVDLISKLPINKVHVFRFSKRPGTLSEKIIEDFGEVTESEKTKRAKILRDLSEKKYQEFIKKIVNSENEALFLKNLKNGFQEVLLNNQIVAFIKTKQDLIGQIKKVKIIEYKNSKIFGKILDSL